MKFFKKLSYILKPRFEEVKEKSIFDYVKRERHIKVNFDRVGDLPTYLFFLNGKILSRVSVIPKKISYEEYAKENKMKVNTHNNGDVFVSDEDKTRTVKLYCTSEGYTLVKVMNMQFGYEAYERILCFLNPHLSLIANELCERLLIKTL